MISGRPPTTSFAEEIVPRATSSPCDGLREGIVATPHDSENSIYFKNRKFIVRRASAHTVPSAHLAAHARASHVVYAARRMRSSMYDF